MTELGNQKDTGQTHTWRGDRRKYRATRSLVSENKFIYMENESHTINYKVNLSI